MIKFLFVITVIISSYGFSKVDGKMLKIATPFKFDKKIIDPAFVRVVQDATLARALYSGLLEYDRNGRIMLGVASNYKIEKNKIEFELGKKTLLFNGEYLNVEDVEFTIKRNLIKNTTTHSKLKGFFYNENEKVQLDQPCSGILLDKSKNKITFILDSENKIDAFITVLTSHDMRIIPRKSTDKNLEIINYKLVSGPYRYEKLSDDGGELDLVANENHYKINKNVAKNVVLKFVETQKLEDSFLKNKIDVIPLFHKMPLELFETLSLKHNSFKTEGIKNMFLRFTKKGFEKFNKEERLGLGNRFKDEYLKLFINSKLFVPGITIYPKLSEAFLSEGDLAELQNAINESINKLKTHKKIKIGATPITYPSLKELFKTDPNIEIVIMEKPILELAEQELPDAYVEAIDSTFTETSNLLIYALRMNLYGHNEKEAHAIINSIYDEKDQDGKLVIIKKVHKQILLEGRAIPFGHLPYVAISNEKWKLNFSKYFAATNLDEITINETN